MAFRGISSMFSANEISTEQEIDLRAASITEVSSTFFGNYIVRLGLQRTGNTISIQSGR